MNEFIKKSESIKQQNKSLRQPLELAPIYLEYSPMNEKLGGSWPGNLRTAAL